MNTTTLLLIFSLLLVATSCDRPECENKNPVFDKNSPGSNAYNHELIWQMQHTNAEHLRFWYDSSLMYHGQEYLVLQVQGKDLCALAHVLVEDKKAKAGLQKGAGYSGAELQNVQIISRNDSGNEVLVLKSIGSILD